MSAFTVFSLSDIEAEKKWFDKLSMSSYKKRLIKNLPFEIEDTSYIKEEGKKIILPFIKREFEILGEDFIKKYIEKIMMMYSINNPYFEGELKVFDGLLSENNEGVLKYLLIKNILENICTKYKQEKKNMKFLIVDSGDRKTEFILELFTEELNYLTIATNREEYFDEFKDIIYKYNGLAVETVALPLNKHLDSNIIINLNDKIYKDFIFLEKNSIVIDLESTLERRQYLYQRRKDIRYIYDVVLTYENEIIDNRLLGNIICNKSWLADGLVKYGKKFAGADEIMGIMSDYNVKIDSLKALNY